MSEFEFLQVQWELFLIDGQFDFSLQSGRGNETGTGFRAVHRESVFRSSSFCLHPEAELKTASHFKGLAADIHYLEFL